MGKYWSVLFAVVILAAGGLFVVAPFSGWWLPINVWAIGGKVDNLFYLILWITTFFFILTEGLLIYNMYVFAAKPNSPKAPFIHGNHQLEIMWTIVPAAILVLLGVVQIGTWEDIKYHSRMPRPDGRTQQIEVQARQWEWRVRYPSVERYEEWQADPEKAKDFEKGPHMNDVHLVNEIHIWQHEQGQDPQRVLVHLRTRDVIHSFFLPTLRLKQDALPGKTIPVWFMADDYNTAPQGEGEARRWVDGYNPKTEQWAEFNEKTGEYKKNGNRIWDLACAEFCGTRHSMMKGRLFVHKDRADFMEWLRHAQKEGQRLKPEEEK